MPVLLTQDRLKDLIAGDAFTKSGIEDSIDGIKYDFRIGDMFLKSTFGEPMKLSELSPAERIKARVEPGEFVFVLTEAGFLSQAQSLEIPPVPC